MLHIREMPHAKVSQKIVLSNKPNGKNFLHHRRQPQKKDTGLLNIYNKPNFHSNFVF